VPLNNHNQETLMISTPTNKHRIDAAGIAFDAYHDAKGLTNPLLQSGQKSLTDLLADLRHFAAAEELDFEAAVRMSEFYYEDESS
jgi:hypothetical protein